MSKIGPVPDAPRQAAEIRVLGNGIYQLPTDYPEVCNAPLWTYLLADGDRFGLVDPGIASTLEATLAGAIQAVGFTAGQADILLATHGHPDHSGGQGSWSEVAPGARVAAPLEDTPWVESFDRQWTRFWDDYPGIMDLTDTRDFLAGLCVPEPRVDILLRDGDTVAVGARELGVVETRGHTWGHCAYFDVGSGALFTGDAVQGHGIRSCDGTSVFAPLYVDVEEARWGLRRLLEVPFTLLCPAHVPAMQRTEGLAFLRDSLSFIDTADQIAREMVANRRSAPLLTRELAAVLGDTVGTRPPVSPQTVATARAHLYALAREGLLEAAWVPGKTG
ncbi:MAG TPA: MBL fold metallo-hydrolase [Streptosporangiaceae bacterium]|jgi:glyoxylase-like metal-dependent hydrolase (beta-lactamase superfamily II)|nr:MBL fold metallo-hydrolase [Streptosporangiaceae bacterium]